MTRRRLVTAALTILIAISLIMAAHAASLRSLVAKVDRVSDGDSVIATTSEGTKLRIRLLGIDAPEIANGTKPGSIPTTDAPGGALSGIVTMGKPQHETGGKHVLLESRLAYHHRCLREDATEPDLTALERLALVRARMRWIREIRQTLERLRRPQ
jgi:hypothetical protein